MDDRFFYMSRMKKFGGIIGHGALYLESELVTPKYSNNKLYYMMLLGLWSHIEVKSPATATWLLKDQSYFCLVMWPDYSFAVTENPFYLPIPTLSTF